MFEEEASTALPAMINKETTLEVFNQLTQEWQQVPFEHPEEPQTDLDIPECGLFDDLSKSCEQHAAYLIHFRGSKRFTVEWDQQASRQSLQSMPKYPWS